MSLGRATIDLDANAAPLDRSLQAAEGSVRSSVAGMSSAMGAGGKATDSFGSKLGVLSAGLTKTGGVLTGAVTVPLVAVGKNALSTAANYEKGMSVLQATTQASGAEMSKLGKLAVDLGADLTLPGTSAVDAGSAMLELGKAGLSVNDIFSGTRGVLELAAAGNLSNADAAEIAANAINAFNLSGSEASRVADLMAASANASSADVSDMAIAFKQSAAVAAQLGVPIEDLTTALAEMANAGIKGSDAGTSVRTMLMRLAAPTDQAKEAMDDLGIATYDAQGNFKSMPELITAVNGGLEGLSQEQKNAALQTIFGADAIRAANVVLLGGVDAYTSMESAVTKTGAAQDLAKAQTTGLAGAWGGLQSTLETLSLQAGEKLAPAFTAIANGISSLVGFLGGLNPNLLAAAGAFVGIIAAAAPLAILLGVIGGALAGLGAPILAVIAGLALLGAAAVLVARNWETVTTAFPEAQTALDATKEGISIMARVAQAVLPGVGQLFLGYAKAVTASLQLVVGALGGVGHAIVDFLTGDWGSIDDDIAGVGEAASRAADMATSSFSDMVDGAKSIRDGLEDVASGADLEQAAIEKSRKAYINDLQALEDVKLGQNEFMDGQAGITQSLQESATALEHWDDLQGAVDKNVTNASDSIGYWQANLDETNTALGYLNDQIERGEPLSAKQQEQYDILTQGAARQTAGIQDQQGAFVDAATAQVEFMNKQDELNAALADGSINQDQYNQAVKDARAEFNSSQGAAGEMANSQQVLADSIDKVVDKLGLLLQQLGIIPPDVTTNLNVNGEKFDSNIKTAGDEILQFSSKTGAATLTADNSGALGAVSDAEAGADGYAGGSYEAALTADNQAAVQAAADAATRALAYATAEYKAKIDADPSYAQTATGQAQADALAYAKAQYEALLLADNSDALAGIGAVNDAIANVQKSFTVYAEFDYTAVTGGMQAMAGYLPNSPAEKGPLSVLPDWDFLTETVPAAMADGASAVADGGTAMMDDLATAMGAGVDIIRKRLDDGGRDAGVRFGNRIRDGAADGLAGTPTLGQLILDAVTAGMEPAEVEAGLSGSDIVDALVSGVVAGLPEWQNIFDLLHGDALTALADMQRDLQGKIRLGEIAGEDVSDLQAKLDAVAAIIATWSEQTGLDFNAEVTSILAPDVSDDVTSAWLDLLGNLGDIISGKAQADLTGQLADLQNQLTVALATGAPQAVIDALNASITATQNQLAQVGEAYAAAVASGMADPTAWLDQLSNLGDIVSGAAQAGLENQLTDLQNQLTVATAVGAPQAVLDALNAQIAATEAQLEQAGVLYQAALDAGITDPDAWQATSDKLAGIIDGSTFADATARADALGQQLKLAEALGLDDATLNALREQYRQAVLEANAAGQDLDAAYAAGLLDPEAKAAYEEAAGIIAQIPIDQLLALAPQMDDGGLSLIESLVDGIGKGSADYEDLWALIQEMGAAAMDGLDSTVGASKDDIIDSLEQLRQSLLDDLADALAEGADPTAIQADLDAVNQALTETQALAEETADVLSTVGVIAGPGAGFGTVGGPGGGGSGSGGGAGGGSSDVQELASSVDNIVSSMLGFQTSAGILSSAIQQAADAQFGTAVGLEGTFADELLGVQNLLAQQGAAQSTALLGELGDALHGQLDALGLTGPQAIGQTILDGMGLSPDVLGSLGLTPDAIAELQTSLGSDQHTVIGTLEDIHDSLERILSALTPSAGAGAGGGGGGGGAGAGGGFTPPSLGLAGPGGNINLGFLGQGRTPTMFSPASGVLYHNPYNGGVLDDRPLIDAGGTVATTAPGIVSAQPVAAGAGGLGVAPAPQGIHATVNLDLGTAVRTVVVDTLTNAMEALP